MIFGDTSLTASEMTPMVSIPGKLPLSIDDLVDFQYLQRWELTCSPKKPVIFVPGAILNSLKGVIIVGTPPLHPGCSL